MKKHYLEKEKCTATFLDSVVNEWVNLSEHKWVRLSERYSQAFRSALYKRGKPQQLYFDHGSNYTSKEILQACVRLDIHLSHAPVRDGAAKGKIERFFRGFRDRFLTQYTGFSSLEELNVKTSAWIEDEYNAKHHTGIQMVPIDRFNLDHTRIQFLTDDDLNRSVPFRLIPIRIPRGHKNRAHPTGLV